MNYTYYLLEWLTGYIVQLIQQWLPTESPITTSCSVQEAGSQLVFSTCRNPEEAGSRASGGRDFAAGARASRQRASFLPYSYIGCHEVGLRLTWKV